MWSLSRANFFWSLKSDLFVLYLTCVLIFCMCSVEPAKCRLSNRRPPRWSLHLLSLWFYFWEYCICADLCTSSLSYLFWPRNGQIFLFIFFSVPCRLKNGLHLLCCAVLAREWSAYASEHFSVHFVCHWIIPVWEVSFWMVKLQKGGRGGRGLRLAYKSQSCI